MPVQQHPVPQHIASYEFHLVGDMTLKQFGYLAGGVMAGLFFYSLPIGDLFKLPLSFSCGFLGFAFAFLPIEERPLSTWLLAFIRAVFSPTLFIWEKRPQELDFFKPVVHQQTPLETPKVSVPQIKHYLAIIPPSFVKNPLDQNEENFLKKVTGLFFTINAPSKTTDFPSPPVFAEEKNQLPLESYSKPPIKKFATKPPIEAIIYAQIKKSKKLAIKAKVSKTLPIPISPSAPNIVSGMVFDQKGEIVEGAILEIRNKDNMPVRALKTNKLGQFIIATPLENGAYEMEVEKEGLNFDIINFETKGEIIPPFEIRAK